MFSARVCGGPRCPLGPGTDVPAQALKLKRLLPAQVTPCICIIPLSKIDIDSITDDPHDESVQRWIPLHLKYRPSHSMWPMKLNFFSGKKNQNEGISYHKVLCCFFRHATSVLQIMCSASDRWKKQRTKPLYSHRPWWQPSGVI